METVWPSLHPVDDRVIVVECDGAIVGCVAFLRKWHMDGAWIRPEDRGRVRVARALQAAMQGMARDLEASEVWMMAMDDEARRLCEHVGMHATHLECDHFAVQFGVD